MKFSLALPVLALASTAAASALSNSGFTPDHRLRAPKDIIASRQAHLRRGLVDVCAGLDVDLELLDIIGPDGKPLITGHLDVCLCVSVIPEFIEVNVAAKAAVLLLGRVRVIAIIEALIKGVPGHNCQYPTHAAPFCDAKFPCNFNCTDGYTPYPNVHEPTSCTCPPPMSECNGKCGHFPYGCGSAVPAARRRSSLPQCIAGRDLCGISGGSSGRGWECLETQSNPESCGGCIVAPPFPSVPFTQGKDCSAIPHVQDFACNAGKCLVKSCLAGFTPSPSLDLCIVEAVAANVANIVGAQEAGAAGVHIARDVADVNALVAEISKKINVANVHSAARDIDALAIETLNAAVGRIADVKEAGLAAVHVGRDIDALALEQVKAIVNPILALKEAGVAGVHVARDIDAIALEQVKAVVDPILALKEAAVAGVHVARDVDAIALEQIKAIIDPILALEEAGAAGVHIGRDIDALALEQVKAVIDPILALKETGVAGVHVARDVDALALEKVEAVVAPIVALKEAGVAGVHVARDIDALALEKVEAVVAPIVALKEAGVAGVHVA